MNTLDQVAHFPQTQRAEARTGLKSRLQRGIRQAWLLLLLSSPVMAAGDHINLVGATVPPFPTGWYDESGMCIGSGLGQDQLCAFNLGVIKKGAQRWLYIGKAASSSTTGKPRWLVTDQMAYPAAPKGFHVEIVPCQRDGEPAVTTVAIVQTTNSEWYTRVRAAYRANLATGLFETVASQGMRCLNAGAGV